MDPNVFSFTFAGYDINFNKGEASFRYELKSINKVFYFTERLTFFPVENKDPQLLMRVKPILDNLLLVLGISYWKTFCPKKITILPFILNRKQADFWNLVYTKGLGEFYFKNHIDFRDRVHFPYSNVSSVPLISASRLDRSLVLFGGGKDSIVSTELLKSNSKRISLFAINPVSLQERIAQETGLEFIRIKRFLDPQLFTLNHESSVYDGHVPISAIYAFVSVFAAALYDYRFIICSNEASSNYGNVDYLDLEVNHQWSKSFEFEQQLSAYINQFVTKDIHYFSLLRAIHEIEVTKLFVRYKRYFPMFSSCNSNFKIADPLRGALWCGKCPKCAFVFVLLASFLPKTEVLQIFGKNLLEDSSLLKTYRELLGFEGFKPFECVGTPQESRWAFQEVIRRKEFSDDSIIKLLTPEMQIQSQEVVFGRAKDHAIPAEFKDVIAQL